MKKDTSAVIELRQYTMKAGRRDEFAGFFDREFVETQEACGIRVLGQFRERGRPDYYVWLRGFESMAIRGEALPKFYTGPTWHALRDRANDMMVDSDDVLLLKPVSAQDGIPQIETRPRTDDARAGGAQAGRDGRDERVDRHDRDDCDDRGLVLATIYLLTAPVDDRFRAHFDEHVAAAANRAGAASLARFETDDTPNNYPRLPLRAGEHAFVWFTTFADGAALHAYRDALARDAQWRETGAPALRRFLRADPLELVLEPTARSMFRHTAPPGFSRNVTGESTDFDFLEGDWRVENRRLRVRGQGSDDWEIFPATSSMRRLLGGLANVDEMRFPEPRGMGMTVRTFDPSRRQWSIYWVSSRDGLLQPPVVGGFAGERGLFYGDDVEGGRPVKVRFEWTRGSTTARWVQSFSFDDSTWETNWVMDFTRSTSGTICKQMGSDPVC